MILGLHIRNSPNAGDRWSSPIDYFDFPGHETMGDDMRPLYAMIESYPAWDAVIYGGGSITASPDFRRWPCPTIAWGVGHHVRERPWDEAMAAEHCRAAALCDLYFPRDCVPGFEDRWTPCASCMHSVFDECHIPQHKVVRYSAARRIDVSGDGDQHMTNEDGSIEDAVRFLGSGETVITSSYHGAFWAHLLGRRVQTVTWGSKFDYVPQLTLAECRAANRAAYKRVMRVLG